MAGEILYSNLGDVRLPAVLAAEVDLLLADRSWLWGLPIFVYRGDVGGRGSDTVKYGSVGLGGYDAMAAVAENASVSVTALTDASVTLAVARQSLARKLSDLARITDPATGRINVTALAADMVSSAAARFTTMTAALGGTFANTTGTSGSDLTVANWFAAILAMELRNVEGPYVAVLHSQQIGDLRTSIRAETGPLGFDPASSAQLAQYGAQMAGSFIGVPIIRCNRVPTANAGADRAGMMLGAGAIHWADAAVPGVAGLPSQPTGGRVSVSFDRDSLGAMTSIVGDYYCGVGVFDAARGENITTDA